MNRPVTERPDWPAAIRDVFVFFNGREPAGEPLEDRIVFYVQMLENFSLLQPGKRVVDLGAGIYWFNPLVRKLGAEVILIDDYGGGGGVDNADRAPALKLVERYRSELGLEVIEQDFLETPLPLPDASADAITCFHSLEHWHNSPKNLFAEITRVLKPGGHLFIATPNAANLRKRIFVLFGANIWSPLEEWYHEQPLFRGHVREPIVRDLHRIMEWNGFDVVATYGRNFIGRDSQVLSFLPRALRHWLGRTTQSVLQYFPTLCSDIHVVGRKR